VIRINPSILSADFVNFEADFNSIAEADFIHVDVMDNHFVPNLTFGLPMVQRMNEITPKPLDVHLMITDADRWAPGYAEAGAASVTFHLEAAAEPFKLAKRLREIGARCGIAVKPSTPIDSLLEHLSEFDQLLIMTVEPGFGGQQLIESTLDKVAQARSRISSESADVWLQVDGGVTEQNIERIAARGADTFVAGSAVFANPNRGAQIAALRSAAEKGHRHH
jgi:ribulose-phosphate 3-epimerase